MLSSAFELTALRSPNGSYFVLRSNGTKTTTLNTADSSFCLEKGNAVENVSAGLMISSESAFSATDSRGQLSSTTVRFSVNRDMNILDSMVMNSRKSFYNGVNMFYQNPKTTTVELSAVTPPLGSNAEAEGFISKNFVHKSKDALLPKRKYTKRPPKAGSVYGATININKPRGGRGGQKRKEIGNNTEQDKFRNGLKEVFQLASNPQGYEFIQDESKRVNVFGVQCRARKREVALFMCEIQSKGGSASNKLIGLLWQTQNNPQKAVVITFRLKCCIEDCVCDRERPLHERIDIVCSCQTILSNQRRLADKCDHVKWCLEHEEFHGMISSLFSSCQGDQASEAHVPFQLRNAALKWKNRVTPTVVDNRKSKETDGICWEVERFVKGREVIISRNKTGINRSWNYWIVVDNRHLSFVPVLRKYGRPLRCYHCLASASLRSQCSHEKACASALCKSGAILHSADEPSDPSGRTRRFVNEDQLKRDKESFIYADNQLWRPPLPCKYDNACTYALARILDHRDGLHLFVLEDPVGITCRKCTNKKVKKGYGRTRTSVALYTVADGCVNCVVIDWVCECCGHLNVYRGEHHSIFPARKYVMYTCEFMYVLVLKSCFSGDSFHKAFQSMNFFWTCTSVQEKFLSRKIIRVDWELNRLRRTANEAFRIFLSRIDIDEPSISGLMFSCKECETDLTAEDRKLFNLTEQQAKGMKRLKAIAIDGTCCGILRELPPHKKKEEEVRKPTETRKKLVSGTGSKSAISKLLNLCRIACREADKKGHNEFNLIQNVVTNRSLNTRSKSLIGSNSRGRRGRGRARGRGSRGAIQTIFDSGGATVVRKRGRPRGSRASRSRSIRGSLPVTQIGGRSGTQSGVQSAEIPDALAPSPEGTELEQKDNYCSVNLSFTVTKAGKEKREMTFDELCLLRYYSNEFACFEDGTARKGQATSTVGLKCTHKSCEERRKTIAEQGKGIEHIRYVLSKLFTIKLGSPDEANCVKDPESYNLNDRSQEANRERYSQYQNEPDVDLINRIQIQNLHGENVRSTEQPNPEDGLSNNEISTQRVGEGNNGDVDPDLSKKNGNVKRRKTGEASSSTKGNSGVPQSEPKHCWMAQLNFNARSMASVVDSCLELLEVLLVENACGAYFHHLGNIRDLEISSFYDGNQFTRDTQKLTSESIRQVKVVRSCMWDFGTCKCGGTDGKMWPCDGCSDKLFKSTEVIGDNNVSIRRFVVEVLKNGHRNPELSRTMMTAVHYVLGKQLEVANGFIEHLNKRLHKTADKYWKEYGKFPIEPMKFAEAEEDKDGIDRGCTFGRFPGKKLYRPPIKFEEAEKQHCNKNYTESDKHSHGIVTVQCTCAFPKMLGFFLLRKPESTALALSCILSYFVLPPRIVYYDNGCNLFSGILHRLPWLLYMVRVLVDLFHGPSHCCSAMYRSDWYKEAGEARTTAAESQNSRHQSITYFAQYLSGENFVPFLALRCALLNFATVLREKGVTGEINDIDIRRKFREEHECTCTHCMEGTFKGDIKHLEAQMREFLFPMSLNPEILTDERRQEVFGESFEWSENAEFQSLEDEDGDAETSDDGEEETTQSHPEVAESRNDSNRDVDG